jgi:hypothetical protein
MLINLKVISIFSLLLFPSCNNRQKNDNSFISVNVKDNIKNQQQINLSQFTDNIQYVPLETKENLPFSWITNIDFSENMILVTNMRLCLLYDYEGHFISKIGAQGRGPGEYAYVSNIGLISPKMICVQDLYDLIEYRLDGLFEKKYLKTFLTNTIYPIGSFRIIDDSLYFGHVSNSTGKAENKAIIVDKHGDIKHVYMNYIIFNRECEVASSFEDYAHIYQFKNSIFYKEFYNDTLFSLTNQYELVPKYVFNLGKYKEPISARALLEQGPSMSRFIYLWNVFQTEEYLLLNFQFGDNFPARRLTPRTIMGRITTIFNTTNVLGIYNKKTKKLTFCKPTNTDNPLFTSGLFNDIDGGPRFFPTNQVNDSTMVMWVKAEELKAHVASDDFKNSIPKYPEKKKQLEDLASRTTVFDNPVLMFVTFKK